MLTGLLQKALGQRETGRQGHRRGIRIRCRRLCLHRTCLCRSQPLSRCSPLQWGMAYQQHSTNEWLSA